MGRAETWGRLGLPTCHLLLCNMGCLSELGLPEQRGTDWRHERQSFIFSLLWKSEITVLAWKTLFSICRRPPSCCVLTWQKELGNSMASSHHSTNHNCESPTPMTSSNPNYVPKTPPSKIPSHWGVRTSTYEFQGWTYILSP